MNRHPELLLFDILEEVESILTSIENVEYINFVTNSEKLKSVKYSFIIIGEAISKLPIDITQKYSFIAWRRIKDFRNVMVHEYFGTDVKLIWKVINEDLPLLKKNIIEIINLEYPESNDQP